PVVKSGRGDRRPELARAGPGERVEKAMEPLAHVLQPGPGCARGADPLFPCSSKLSPGSGGPGGAMTLGFYGGYTRGGGPTGAPNGTPVAVFTLTGLPGNSASSSFFGGFTCYFAEVQFISLVSFRDGNIGYSWRFTDVGDVRRDRHALTPLRSTIRAPRPCSP